MLALVPDIEGVDRNAAALLIECRGKTAEGLKVSLSICCALTCLQGHAVHALKTE